jgi:hypothetical protein
VVLFILFWNYSASVVFLLDFWIICVFHFIVTSPTAYYTLKET